MASASIAFSTAALLIDGRNGDRRVPLDGDRYRLGRSASNELCFPDDAGLSREHLVFERSDKHWTVRDVGSRNGTLINGARLSETEPAMLADGDRVAAGHLTITFLKNGLKAPPPGNSVVIVDEPTTRDNIALSVAVDLKTALESGGAGGISAPGNAHLRAFVKAGRELVSHRPLQELFKIILDISVNAVSAFRGVLMTLDGAELRVRALCGEGFRISSGVVDRVLKEKTSLLIRDASEDVNFSGRESIVAGQVRSILAVPLQTDEHAIGLIYVDSPLQIRNFTSDDLNLLTVMANIAAIRIEHARLVEIEQADKLLAHDLQQAAEIQRALLPARAPDISGFDIAGYNAACRTVGGDYYDFLNLSDGRLGMVVGDVAGKGMPAALLMSSLHARVQAIFEDGDNLAGRVERLNHTISPHCPGNRFITLFIAALDSRSGEMRFCNAGHNPPVLLRADGSVETLEATGMVLGISRSARYEEGSCQMKPGDLLVLYSDGLTEACDPGNDAEFGEDRLLSILRECRQKPAALILDGIKHELAQFTRGAPPTDDVTVVIARRID
jgi:phosphoserine phosphatase RsbU/P